MGVIEVNDEYNLLSPHMYVVVPSLPVDLAGVLSKIGCKGFYSAPRIISYTELPNKCLPDMFTYAIVARVDFDL